MSNIFKPRGQEKGRVFVPKAEHEHGADEMLQEGQTTEHFETVRELVSDISEYEATSEPFLLGSTVGAPLYAGKKMVCGVFHTVVNPHQYCLMTYLRNGQAIQQGIYSFLGKVNGLWYAEGDTTTKPYDHVYYPRLINNRPAFLAEKTGKEFIVMDGKRYGEGYDELGAPVDCGGVLAYKARRGKTWCIVHDSIVVETQSEIVSDPFFLNNTIAYTAESDKKVVLMCDFKQVGDEYLNITNVTSIRGTPAFMAETENGWCLNLGGKLLSDSYDYVGKIVEYDGAPVFRAKENEKWCIDTPAGYPGWYDFLRDVVVCDSKLVFASKKGGVWSVTYAERVCGTNYSDISDLSVLHGRPFFIGSRDSKESYKEYVVQVSPEGRLIEHTVAYDKIYSLTEGEDGTIVILGKRGDEYVTEVIKKTV